MGQLSPIYIYFLNYKIIILRNISLRIMRKKEIIGYVLICLFSVSCVKDDDITKIKKFYEEVDVKTSIIGGNILISYVGLPTTTPRYFQRFGSIKLE